MVAPIIIAALVKVIPLIFGIGLFAVGGFFTGIFRWMIVVVTLLLIIKIFKAVF